MPYTGAVSWWIEPETFEERARAFNREAKVSGSAALPRAVRDYLDRLEDRQHREASLLPRRPKEPTRVPSVA